MPRTPYDIDYSKLYPDTEISDEVLAELKKSDRKMKYLELDLNQEKPIRDEDGLLIGLSPSKEDSLDRLIALGKQFVDDVDVADQMFKQINAQELYRVLDLLDDEDRALVDALFFNGLSERQYAAKIKLSKTYIHARKVKILTFLKDAIVNIS